MIKHEDFIPSKYLPTFNINTIEMNFFRIPELSENFIYFNDDTLPLQPIDEEYFLRMIMYAMRLLRILLRLLRLAQYQGQQGIRK